MTVSLGNGVDIGNIVTSETNPLTGGISLSAGSQVLTGTPVMTFAELKTALTAGFVGTAFVSDIGGGTLWVSDGVSASPHGGTVDIYNSASRVNFNTSNVRSVGIEIPLPAGLVKNFNVLECQIFASKNGATDPANIQVNLGAVPGTVGPQLGGSSVSMNVVAANRRIFGIFRFVRQSATSLALLNGTVGSDGTASPTTIETTSTTVANMDSATTYLQITNAMGVGAAVDVMTLEKVIIRLGK